MLFRNSLMARSAGMITEFRMLSSMKSANTDVSDRYVYAVETFGESGTLRALTNTGASYRELAGS